MRLNNRALNLALHQRRIDRLAKIISRNYPQEAQVTGLSVYFHFDGLRYKRVGKIWFRISRFFVELRGHWGKIFEFTHSRTFLRLPAPERLSGRAADRVTCHKG